MRILWCGAILLCGWWCNAGAQSAPALRPEVAVLLTAAQDALKAKNPALALDHLEAASALPQLTGRETEFLQRLRVVAGVDVGKPTLAMVALEALIATPGVPSSEKPALIESLISLAQKQKDHQRVIDAGQLFSRIPAAPTRGTLLALAQAHYFLKHYDLTVAQINALLAPAANTANTAASVHTKPEEYLLRMLADSHTQLKNRAGYLQTLALLLQHYPSQAYWTDYLSRHISQLEAGSPFALDWYRLVRATQNLEEADDYLEYVQLALKSGFPQEAQSVLEQGLRSGLLGTGSNKQAVDTLRPQIARRISEDTAAQEMLEKQLPGAANGIVAAQLADLHLANGRWAPAHSLYLSALEKGGLRREEQTRVRRGIALALDGQKDTAFAALAGEGLSPGARTLTQAWTLWVSKAQK